MHECKCNCDFGALADDMIRDQIIAKTSSLHIRERLLLETDLTLQKAITIASQIAETAVAEAKAMAPATEATVQVVQRRTNLNPSALPARCGSNSHLDTCSARNANCKQCGKIGHVVTVCRSAASTYNVQEVAVPDLYRFKRCSHSNFFTGPTSNLYCVPSRKRRPVIYHRSACRFWFSSLHTSRAHLQ